MINSYLQNEDDLLNFFCKYFYSEKDESTDIKDLYLMYYALSKNNGNNWSIEFTQKVYKKLKSKNLPVKTIEHIIETLEFKLLINKNIFININSIINGELIDLKNYDLKKNILNQDLKLNHYINYCNSFLTYKLYSLLNNYYLIRKQNFNYTTFESLFNDINDCSLYGKFIYKVNNNYIFKINISKYSDFFLFHDNKINIIYESLSEQEDLKNTFLNFIHANSIYSDDKESIKQKILSLEKTSKEDFVKMISNDEYIDYYLIKESINENVNFIFNFDYKKIDYHFNQNEIFCLYLKHISNGKIQGKKINANLSNLFIKENAYQHKINNINNDYIEDIIVMAITTIKDYNNLIINTSFSFKDINIIKEILLSILSELFNEINRNNSNEETIKNLMYNFGLFNKKNRDDFYKNLSYIKILKIKDIDKIFTEDFKWIATLINNLNFEMISNEISDMIKLKIIIKKNIFKQF